MQLILVYDANAKRVNNLMKLCRIYLHHIQNSVFYGSITLKNYNEFIKKIKSLVNINEDSVIIFKIRSEKEIKKEIIGVEKGNNDNIIVF